MLCFFMYCCKRKCVQVTLALFSVLFFIAAGVQIYMTVRLKNYEIWNDSGDASMQGFDAGAVDKGEKVKKGLYYGCIVLSSLTIVLAFLGLITAKVKNCCSLCMFSSLSLLFTIVTIAVGVCLLVVTIGSRKYID